jgi:uncharacterized protein YdcH (DUF465 family)
LSVGSFRSTRNVDYEQLETWKINVGKRDLKSAGKRLAILKERHQTLDDEIDLTVTRRWLSEEERMRIKELKVRRLRLRDLIDSMERKDGG